MDAPASLLVTGTLLGLLLPGYLLLRGLRVPPSIAIGAAPALLAGAVAPLTIQLRGSFATGDGWMMTVWVVAGAMALAGAVLWVFSPKLAEAKREPSRLLMGVALGAMVIALAVTAYQILVGMGGLDVPLQRRDSVSHYNVIAGIFNEWGTVHPLETRGWMIGAKGAVSFYPSTFHALAAAIPVEQGVVAGNILAVVCAFLWIIGLTSLARVLFPTHPGAWIAAPLVTLLTISFPFIAMFRQGQWPFGLSLALTPGVLALFLYAVRSRSILGGLGVLLGIVGIIALHPSGVAVFAAVVFAAAVVELGERAVAASSGRVRTERLMPPAVALLILVGTVAVYVIASQSPSVIAMGSYARPQTPALELTGAMVSFGHFSVNEPFPIAPAIGLIALLVIGSLVAVRHRTSRTFFGAGLVFFIFLLLTPLEGNVAHVTGAFWYGDPERLLAVLSMFTTLAAALGAGWLVEKIAPRVAGDRDIVRGGVSLLIVTLALSITWLDRNHVRTDIIVEGNFQPSFTSPYFVGGPAWDDGDAEFWQGTAEIVGNDAVMTDSASGGVLLPAMANVRAVPAVTTFSSMPPHGQEAAWMLRDPDPLPAESAACVFLHENDIRWIYLERAYDTRFAASHFRSTLVAPHGELVAEDGPRELWRINDCWN
ncbi:DUF6541 family protein [Flaviflexus huanghaiensis]|uniref:DUF6541 family protein n=1 Tax=Flaviflexus huanghaiensis TaxID=1111473 RepID=UPI0015F91048|nr:DUF6541 family protein [Flaviflexus huanghaiensis]